MSWSPCVSDLALLPAPSAAPTSDNLRPTYLLVPACTFCFLTGNTVETQCFSKADMRPRLQEIHTSGTSLRRPSSKSVLLESFECPEIQREFLHIVFIQYFTTCQLTVSRFYQGCVLLPSFLPSCLPFLPSFRPSVRPSFLPSFLLPSGPQLPAPDLSGHCRAGAIASSGGMACDCRTSTASAQQCQCQRKCQTRMPSRMPCQIECRNVRWMPERMSEYMPDRLPQRKSE